MRTKQLGWGLALLMATALSGLGACGSDDDKKNGGGTPSGVDCKREVCPKIAAAGCSDTQASCEQECDIVATKPNCKPQADTYLACAKGATASCDADGEAEFAACAAQLQAAQTCFAGGGGGGNAEVLATCKEYCDRQESDGCSIGLDACKQLCDAIIGPLGSDCAQKQKASYDCQMAEPDVCEAASECQDEMTAAGNCLSG
jgi:hypothetical protein